MFIVFPQINKASTFKNLNIGIPSNQKGEIASINAGQYYEWWHHSGGYWDCTGVVGRIYDNELKYWGDPNKIALKEGITGEVKIPIPEAVKKTNGKFTVGLFCGNSKLDIKDIIAAGTVPQYKIEDDYIIIKLVPVFKCVSIRFNDHLESGALNKAVPIVDPLYGSNIYSMFDKKTNTHLGMAFGSFEKEALKISAVENEIKDASGNLNTNKEIEIAPGGGKSRFTRKGSEIKIGNGTFADAGAVGLAFSLPYVVKFYKTEADPEPTPKPTPKPTPTPTPGNINLKASIVTAPSEGYKGTNVSVTAKVTCQGAKEPFATRIVWYVNDKQVAHNDMFVLQNERKNTITVKIPSGGADVKFIVNPDKNKPSNETTYADNTAQKTIAVKPDPDETPGDGNLVINITKADGTSTIAVHPQWRVDSTMQLQSRLGASWAELFERGMVDKASYPELNGHWNEAADFKYLNNTLVAKKKTYNVAVKHIWTQTYHKEWKIIGSHKELVTDYSYNSTTGKWYVSGSHTTTVNDWGWVDVADPVPTANVTVNTKTSGTTATQIAYNIISGEDAEISTQHKESSQSDTLSIPANTSKTLTYVMPAYSELYPNKYNYFESSDDGKAYIKVTASANVPSKTCPSCGQSIDYYSPKTLTQTKTIAVKACSVYSKSARLGRSD